MRTVKLTCRVCGREWERQRMVGSRPKTCPDCRRGARTGVYDVVPLSLRRVKLLGPVPCKRCRTPIVWARLDGLRQWRDPRTWRKHRCLLKRAVAA